MILSTVKIEWELNPTKIGSGSSFYYFWRDGITLSAGSKRFTLLALKDQWITLRFDERFFL